MPTSPPRHLQSQTPSTPSPFPVDFLEILENWKIPNLDISAILPASLRSSSPVCPTTTTKTQACVPTTKSNYPWTPALLHAIRALSFQTVGERDRAHNLLTTYSRARLRETSLKKSSGSMHARLEVEDVEKAVESARKMNKGREIEGGSVRAMAVAGAKRKCSLPDENAGHERVRRVSKRLGRVIEARTEEQDDADDDAEKINHDMVNDNDKNDIPARLQPTHAPSSATTPSPQRRPPPFKSTLPHPPPPPPPPPRRPTIPLPPLQTSNLTTPTTPPQPISPHTHPLPSPSPKRAPPKTRFDTTPTPTPTLPPHPYAYHAPTQTPTQANPPPDAVFPPSNHTTRITSRAPGLTHTQHQTHLFNLRRLELRDAEVALEAARARFWDARRRLL